MLKAPRPAATPPTPRAEQAGLEGCAGSPRPARRELDDLDYRYQDKRDQADEELPALGDASNGC
jgi:hypothetical protein